MVFGSGSKRGQFGKKEEVQETGFEVPVVEKVDEPEYTSMAFSLGRHPNNNGFALISVAFNPVTMEARVVEVEHVGESRAVAEDSFKVKVGNFFGKLEMEGR